MSNQSRTKKFAYNSITTALQQLTVMLVGFVVPRIMLQYYGSEINGLSSSINQFITYFNLVEAGLSGAAVYALYKPLADNNITEISSVVSAAKKFYKQAGCIFLALIILLSIIYPAFISTSALDKISTGLLVLVLGFSGCMEFFTLAKYRALLTADQKTYVISLATIVQTLMNAVIIILFAKYQYNIVILRGIAQLAIISRSVILWLYCRKHYPDINYNEKPNIKTLDKRWSALFLQVLNVIQQSTPVMIMTLLLRDLKAISVYTVCNIPISGINGILGIFKSGLAAGFGELIAKKEIVTLQRAYQEFELAFYAIISFIYSVALVMMQPFVNIYTDGITDTVYNRPVLCILMVIWGLMYNLKTPQGMLVISAGLYKETQWRTAVQGVIGLIAGIGFSFVWGIEGIVLGIIVSDIYRNIDLLFYIPKYVTKLSYTHTLKRWSIVFAHMALVYTVTNFLGIQERVISIVDWILVAVSVSIFSIVVLFVLCFVFDRQILCNLITRIKRILCRG